MAIILKAAPDLDLYCVWSTVADGPVFIGTEEEVLSYLSVEWADYSRSLIQAIGRAIDTGTSDRHLGLGGFDDDGLVVQDLVNERQAWLPRGKFTEFFTLYSADRKAASAVLEPIKDEG